MDAPAMILVVVYVVLVASIHAQASPQKWVYGQIGLSFALLSAVVLLGDYFVQFVFLAPVFAHQGRLASAVGWVFVAGFVLITAFLVVISAY